MKTLNYLLSTVTPSDPFFGWLVKVDKIVGGDTAVSETVALSAWRRGVTPRTFAEFLQKRDRGGAL